VDVEPVVGAQEDGAEVELVRLQEALAVQVVQEAKAVVHFVRTMEVLRVLELVQVAQVLQVLRVLDLVRVAQVLQVLRVLRVAAEVQVGKKYQVLQSPRMIQILWLELAEQDLGRLVELVVAVQLESGEEQVANLVRTPLLDLWHLQSLASPYPPPLRDGPWAEAPPPGQQQCLRTRTSCQPPNLD